MREITFGNPVLKVKGLEVKFDVIPVSSSLAVLLGDRDLATIVQQLSYWTFQGYGEVIDGVRWFYKSIAEWIEEVFPTFTPWKLGKMMKQLSDRKIIRREKLFTKHQIQNGDRFWWQPKNQTYYYSLNTLKLQELADNFQVTEEEAEPPETSVSTKTQILSNEEITDTKLSECAKNNTKNTSIKNSSKDKSHPTLPSERESLKPVNQEKGTANTSELSSTSKETKEVGNNSKAIAQSKSSACVDKKVNQNKSTVQDNVRISDDTANTSDTKTVNSAVSQPKPKVSQKTKTKTRRNKQAPWKDESQFKQFYRALIQALPIVANSHSPQGLAQTIIKQLRCGIPHSYWDDFEAGQPIGTSTKPEWEITPGEPYPMFVEYLTEKIKRGDNSTSEEQTRNAVFRILAQPRQVKAFWGQFKRSVVNLAKRVESDRALGVTNPATPVWTRERIEPSIDEAVEAGEKIMAVNDSASNAIANVETPRLETQQSTQSFESDNSQSLDKSTDKNEDPWNDEETEADKPAKPSLRELVTQRLGNRNLKGFVKAMPKVTKSEAVAEEEAQTQASNKKRTNRKTNIEQMSIAEINEALKDPVMRKELTPQIFVNDKFDVVTDNLGEVLAVKINRDYLLDGET